MGGSASKPKLSIAGNAYSEKAKVARELSDRILTLFFNEADFKDLLTLASIESCPKYIFTTATALSTLFHSLQVDPKLGKAGEVYYAPIAKVAPGLIKEKKDETQAIAELRQQRDRMCMDVAYMFVRVFQIYGALAMTVIDTDPVRRRLTYGAPAPAQRGFFSSTPKPAGPARATFFGGAPTTRTGKSKAADRFKYLINTPFIILKDYFSAYDPTPEGYVYYELDDKSGVGQFIIQAKTSRPPFQEVSYEFEGYYRKRGVSTSTKFKIKMEYEDDTRTSGVMYIDGKEFQKFVQEEVPPKWMFYDESYNQTTSDPSGFIQKVHDYFKDTKGATSTSGRTGSSSGVSYSYSSGISAPGATKSSFEGFDQLKKAYEDRFTGKPFPKAYCIGRAMILLTPLFDSEQLDPSRKNYYSQVCKRTFDFEFQGYDFMPRARKQPKANLYWKSLTSLFYDEYQVRGGQVVFSMSNQSRTQLRDTSTRLAALHEIKQNPETFIESSTEFRESTLCGGKEALLFIRDQALYEKIMKECILPMLKLQEDHTKAVNDLLKKMFLIVTDKTGTHLKFSNELRAGRAGVNLFAEQARNLLVPYYLKSEAYYMQGVRLLERNPAGVQTV